MGSRSRSRLTVIAAVSKTRERNAWIRDTVRLYNSAPMIPCGFKPDLDDEDSTCGKPADWRLVFEHSCRDGRLAFLCESHRQDLIALMPLRCVVCGREPVAVTLMEPLR